MEPNLAPLHEAAVEVAHRLTQFDSYEGSPTRVHGTFPEYDEPIVASVLAWTFCYWYPR